MRDESRDIIEGRMDGKRPKTVKRSGIVDITLVSESESEC